MAWGLTETTGWAERRLPAPLYATGLGRLHSGGARVFEVGVALQPRLVEAQQLT